MHPDISFWRYRLKLRGAGAGAVQVEGVGAAPSGLEDSLGGGSWGVAPGCAGSPPWGWGECPAGFARHEVQQPEGVNQRPGAIQPESGIHPGVVISPEDVISSGEASRLIAGGGGNARSGRGVLEGMLIRVDGGYGCIQPWPELGDEPLREHWESLHGRRAHTRLVARALDCARVDGAARRDGRSLFAGLRVPWSHATVIGDADFVALKAEGFSTVKLKGGRDWTVVLGRMRQAVAAGLRIRVDFNGVLTADGFEEFAEAAEDVRHQVDFVEDPVVYDGPGWRQLTESTGWPLALDRVEGGSPANGGFALRVVKPALETVRESAVPVVFTSNMDHPLGQVFAAWEAARYGGEKGEAGLLTHRLFEGEDQGLKGLAAGEGLRSWQERLGEMGPELKVPGGTGLGFDDLLESLPWQPLVRQGNRGRAGMVLENPRDPLAAAVPAMAEGEIGFPTSGSTGSPAVVVHKDDSLEASAAAVNEWLSVGAEDVWLRALPLFHVGGQQILTRAELSGSRVVAMEGKWSAPEFVRICQAEGATLASLVPAQVFDVVSGGMRSPAGLRAVVVGGGALEAELWRKAREMGWPVLPSYGSSEAASQVATARLARLDDVGMPPMELLPVWRGRVLQPDGDGGGLLELAGPALASGRMVFEGGIWRREGLGQWAGEAEADAEAEAGWWRTSDRVILAGRELRFAGRADRVVKVLGELVNLLAVERMLAVAGFDLSHCALFPMPDARRGNALVLVTERDFTLECLDRFNQSAPPFARLERVVRVGLLPRSPLGKIRYGELGGLIPPAVRG